MVRLTSTCRSWAIFGFQVCKDIYRDIDAISQKSLHGKERVSLAPSQRQCAFDAFVDLEAALGIVVRSRKPKTVELVKWLTRKGVEKVVQEKRGEPSKKGILATCNLLC